MMSTVMDPAGIQSPSGQLKVQLLGVGYGGSEVVSGLYATQELPGVGYYCLDTDLQYLEERCAVPDQIWLGSPVAGIPGTLGDPDNGRKAAESSAERIRTVVAGTDLVILIATLGGGTGTGATPVIGSLAKEAGAVVVGVVTTPFAFEARDRIRNAEEARRQLESSVDVLVSISLAELLEQGRLANGTYTCDDAVGVAHLVVVYSVDMIIHDPSTLKSAGPLPKHFDFVLGIGGPAVTLVDHRRQQ